MESILSNVLMFVLGLIGLSFLVTIHELGHFLVAKWNNVKVNTFSIGFGKKLIKFRHGETEYSIWWLCGHGGRESRHVKGRAGSGRT